MKYKWETAAAFLLILAVIGLNAHIQRQQVAETVVKNDADADQRDVASNTVADIKSEVDVRAQEIAAIRSALKQLEASIAETSSKNAANTRAREKLLRERREAWRRALDERSR